MDTTEQRAGFRLPWSDRREPPAPDDGGGGPPEDAEANQMQHDMEIPPPEGETAPSVGDAAASDATTDGGAPAAAPDAAPARRPSRFLAELTRAMHAAAEEGRVATLDQLRADGKTAVEEIQSRSADGATSIRRNADEDVTRIREWSKAEIARIREETEQRIAARKVELDRDLEGHAAVVEAEIENVQGQVSAFETEMDAFFEKLIAEEDPGRFAALAASLPEPPPFTPLSETERAAVVARATGTGVVEESPEGVADEPAAEAMAVAEVGEAETEAEPAAVEAQGEPVAETTQSPPTDDGGEWPADAEATGAGDVDPRLAALPDLADAERDALADVSASEADGEGAADGSISARLAGLTAPVHPAAAEAPSESGPVETSQVVVTGLTSVSSIAAFKRQLGRLDGVRSVAVSSGPSGEFVFAVTHAPGVQLADGVTSLGGFSPQIGRVEPGLVELTARDPEA
ncbi:MAG: hypothetical protein MUE82_00100 [Chloroflexi bacterium]|nr:hypothetical protein [Chloroflexota bacterium]